MAAIIGDTNGIEWKVSEGHADLDFVDDIALMKSAWEGMIGLYKLSRRGSS